MSSVRSVLKPAQKLNTVSAEDHRVSRGIRELLLDVFLEIHRADFRAVYSAMAAHRDAFRGARCALGIRVWDESGHLAVFRASNANTSLTARVIAVAGLVVRFRVGYVHRVVLVDKNSAGAAKLFPLGDKFP